MIESEVFEVIAYWEATFRGTLTPSERSLYLMHLQAVDRLDAFAAIDDCARRGEFPPSPQRIAEVSVSARYDRVALEQHATPFQLERGEEPGFAEWLEANPDQRELLAALKRAVPGVEMTEADRVTLGQLKPPKQDPVDLQMCSGVGKRSVLVKGVECCPECSSPIADGCYTRKATA